MAGYSLIGSYATVQVLAPTVINDVVYCTIQTHPSDVIASMPINEDIFNKGGGGPELTAYSNAIEQIMARDEVIAAVGSQRLLPSGLLSDTVIFTVQYVPPGSTNTAVTAECVIPAASLNFEDGQIGSVLLQSVLDKIEAVYNNLVATASG